jgi:hypothetical protein
VRQTPLWRCLDDLLGTRRRHRRPSIMNSSSAGTIARRMLIETVSLTGALILIRTPLRE